MLRTFAAFSIALVTSAALAAPISIPTVPVGNAGNAPSGVTGYGGVAYNYRMGTTEVTNEQYVAFLNAVATTDTYRLYETNMASDALGGIERSGVAGSYSYATKSGFGNLPVVFITWGDAARFCNWLSNGQPTGNQDATTTERGSYMLDGATTHPEFAGVTRTASAQFVIPSIDEWYKAAYHNAEAGWYYPFPTESLTAPSNDLVDAGNNANYFDGDYTAEGMHLTPVGHFSTSESPYGTYDQGGNVWEWTEQVGQSNSRGQRGGGWDSSQDYLRATEGRSAIMEGAGTSDVGFRVALVPEPSSYLLGILALIGLTAFKQRK
jgi:sulfatase modifying factor 1